MTSRKCGSCTLCCKLLPTEEIGSPANTRCQHQCTKGCRIYSRRPMSCQLWSCRWLVGPDTADQPRPDRSHIVVDMMPDLIRVTDNASGQERDIPVLVAWVDPDHKAAVESEPFLRYVRRQTMPVLIRFGSLEGGGVLFPPALTGLADVTWQQSELGQDMPNTLEQKAAALGAVLELTPAVAGYSRATMTLPDGTKMSVAAGDSHARKQANE